MAGFLDKQEVSFECPGCGRKLKQTIGRLKKQSKMVCPGCGADIEIKDDGLGRELDKVEKDLKKLFK
jgi:predicted RNA-binding Zn-ribbon protein involved in translation (DUF1610 family)